MRMAIVTISRQMGTGAYAMAKELSKKLKYTLIDGPKLRSWPKVMGWQKIFWRGSMKNLPLT